MGRVLINASPPYIFQKISDHKDTIKIVFLGCIGMDGLKYLRKS